MTATATLLDTPELCGARAPVVVRALKCPGHVCVKDVHVVGMHRCACGVPFARPVQK